MAIGLAVAADILVGDLRVSPETLTAYVSEKRLSLTVPLAILDNERFPALPNIPTLKEAGFPGAEASAWIWPESRSVKAGPAPR